MKPIDFVDDELRKILTSGEILDLRSGNDNQSYLPDRENTCNDVVGRRKLLRDSCDTIGGDENADIEPTKLDLQ
jgi:hypothetical protein